MPYILHVKRLQDETAREPETGRTHIEETATPRNVTPRVLPRSILPTRASAGIIEIAERKDRGREVRQRRLICTVGGVFSSVHQQDVQGSSIASRIAVAMAPVPPGGGG